MNLISLLSKFIIAGSNIRVKFSSGLKVFEVNKLTPDTLIKQFNDFFFFFYIHISHDKQLLSIVLCILSITGL